MVFLKLGGRADNNFWSGRAYPPARIYLLEKVMEEFNVPDSPSLFTGESGGQVAYMETHPTLPNA